MKNLKDQLIQGISDLDISIKEYEEKIFRAKGQKREVTFEIKREILSRTKKEDKICKILLLQITSRQNFIDQIFAEIFDEEDHFRIASISLHKNILAEKFEDMADIKKTLSNLNTLIDNVIVFSIKFEEDNYYITADPQVPVFEQIQFY